MSPAEKLSLRMYMYPEISFLHRPKQDSEVTTIFSEEANLLFTSPLEPFRPTHTTHTIQTHLLSLSLVRQPHHPGPDLSQTQKKKKKKKNDPPHPLALHQIPPRRPPPPHRHRNPARPRQLPNLPLRRRHMRLLPDGPGGDCADGG